MRSPNTPWVLLLIGLLIATVLEALVSAPLRALLLSWAPAARWLVTLAFVAFALWVGARYYLPTLRRPQLGQVVLVVFVILLAFRLLAERIGELPTPYAALAAGLVGALAGTAIWRLGRFSTFRTWLAPLFGILVFINLLYGGRSLPPPQ